MQALGKDIESIYVEELGGNLSREEIFKVLVIDIMEGAIEVDWRDFFPYLKWVPNRSVESKIRRMIFRRQAVMKALIKEQKRRIASGEVTFFSTPFDHLTNWSVNFILWMLWYLAIDELLKY